MTVLATLRMLGEPWATSRHPRSLALCRVVATATLVSQHDYAMSCDDLRCWHSREHAMGILASLPGPAYPWDGITDISAEV